MRRVCQCGIALIGLSVSAFLLRGDLSANRDAKPQVPAQRLASKVDARSEASDFTADELRYLERRFGVHGPQTRLAQLFTDGVDQLQPLRAIGRCGDKLEMRRSGKQGLNGFEDDRVVVDGNDRMEGWFCGGHGGR